MRAIAVITLGAGVLGGMHLGNLGWSADEQPDSAAVTEAETMEQELQKTHLAQWLRGNAQQRELEAAAKKRAAAEARAASERAQAAEQEASRRGADRSVDFGPIPSSCNSFSGNRAIGCALLLEAGFGLDQMECLDKLWTKESGWNHKALNTSSGAYGIPQALPGNKMATTGDDWQTNPATQIKWGLGYIKGRYTTPCNAWSHSVANGWY